MHTRERLERDVDDRTRPRERAEAPVVPAAPQLSPAQLLALQHGAGNRAVAAMVARAPAGAVAEAQPVATADKSDALLAGSVVEKELAILSAWLLALMTFDKVMVSESDEAGKPDFQKAVVGFVAEQVQKGITGLVQVPGAGLPADAIKALETEFKRAQGAQDSARIRDFFVAHIQALASTHRQLSLIKDDFEAGVARVAATKNGDDQQIKDYWYMRMVLESLHADVESRLAAADQVTLFNLLSQEWIKTSKVRHGFAAHVTILLNPDRSVRNATIQGQGGQKLAEQLLKNEPDGVDLMAMQVPRRIYLYAENGWPRDIVQLDAAGSPTYAEGDGVGLHRWLQQNPLPRIKKISGD